MRTSSGAALVERAFAPMLLGGVLAIVAFGAGVVVAAIVFAADAARLVPLLVGVGVVIAVVGAICGGVIWRTAVDRIGGPRSASESRRQRTSALGRARTRARWSLDRRDRPSP